MIFAEITHAHVRSRSHFNGILPIPPPIIPLPVCWLFGKVVIEPGIIVFLFFRPLPPASPYSSNVHTKCNARQNGNPDPEDGITGNERHPTNPSGLSCQKCCGGFVRRQRNDLSKRDGERDITRNTFENTAECVSAMLMNNIPDEPRCKTVPPTGCRSIAVKQPIEPIERKPVARTYRPQQPRTIFKIPRPSSNRCDPFIKPARNGSSFRRTTVEDVCDLMNEEILDGTGRIGADALREQDDTAGWSMSISRYPPRNMSHRFRVFRNQVNMNGRPRMLQASKFKRIPIGGPSHTLQTSRDRPKMLRCPKDHMRLL